MRRRTETLTEAFAAELPRNLSTLLSPSYFGPTAARKSRGLVFLQKAQIMSLRLRARLLWLLVIVRDALTDLVDQATVLLVRAH
ncbi:hypothetical protein AM571_PB00256 (plasmid) [Rhizobium etli 8C-3]|uniref:Uncharacterized protein n=1 Tax=Rhizobium etli 8C-3 TaxID=538025 RepID=A0A1L5PBH5_RHIET|nr:hypothetical protein AM571_PB00256 [Rhizobium etli 8C-3]EGE56323.1 hypothetical protein RHECNPAF_715009 [Rhizobium etli CNPAF512]